MIIVLMFAALWQFNYLTGRLKMTVVNPITKFVAYLPNSDDRGREELAHVANESPELGLDTLRQDNYFLAAATAAPSKRPDENSMLLDVFPGTAASTRLATANFRDATTVEDIHNCAEQSAQCYNLLQASDSEFSLQSDGHGLKPVYIAHTPGGTLLGSRIGDLLHLFPSLTRPTDTVAIYELIVFRTTLAQRTLHQRIRRTLAGGCYRWTPAGGLTTRRGRDISPAPVEPLRFLDQTIDEIHHTAGRSLLEKTAGASKPIAISFSGGLDSRLIAALCQEHGIDIRALSYGRSRTNESVSAKAAARVLGLDLEMIQYQPDNTLRHLPHHLKTIEGLADPAMLQVMNLFGAKTTLGDSLLHGYGGNLPDGDHTQHLSAADYVTHDTLVDGILNFFSDSQDPQLRELFVPAIDPDEVRQDVYSNLRIDCTPHQAYTWWEFEDRHRSFVGSNITLIGHQLDPILPLYDRRLLALWTSIPPIGLANRNVFRTMFAHYYPALARIPHPEESEPIIPNLRWQLARFYRSLPKRGLNTVIGSKRTEDMFLRLYKHDYIWNLGNLAAPKERAYMLARVMDLRPMIEDGMGVTLSPDYEKTLAPNLQALRGMFLVAEYAAERSKHM